MTDWQALRDEIRVGSTSARKLVDVCLSSIAARNDALNAYLGFDAQSALEAAIASDRRYRDGQPLSPIAASTSLASSPPAGCRNLPI